MKRRLLEAATSTGTFTAQAKVFRFLALEFNKQKHSRAHAY